MRKLAIILLSVSVIIYLLPVFLLSPARAEGNAIMVLTSERTDYYVGETVYVDIEVRTNGEALNVTRAIMNYTGGDVIIMEDFDVGDTLPYLSPGSSWDSTTGAINVGTFILMASVSDDFVSGTLIFHANRVGSSDIGKPFLTGSHLISPQQEEKINLAGCQGITINVIEPVVPNNPPIVQSQSLTVEVGDQVNTMVSAFDPDNDNVTLSWDPQYNGNFSNPTSGPTATAQFSYLASQIGTFNFPFIARDDHATDPKQVSGLLTIIVEQDVTLPPPNLAPIFQPVANKSLEVGQQVSFQVLATDPNGDNIDLSWNIPADALFVNVNENLPTASGDFRWTPLSAGSYIVNFTALDDHPTDPKSANLTVIINVSVPEPPTNRPPNFRPEANKSINLGDPVNFTVRATDPDGDIVTLTWDIPTGASLINVTSDVTATGDFRWTPTAEGVYTLIFHATDDNPDNPLSSTLTVSVAVSVPPPPPNHPPVFAPVTEKTALAGETLIFGVSATDSDGDNVTITMEPLETATWLQAENGATASGLFAWQPATYGIYYVLFTAIDDHPDNPLSSSLRVRITVFGGECPPCGGGTCPILTCEEVPELEEPPLIDIAPPVINSPSHPSQQLWFSQNEPQFTWEVAQEGEGYIFNLDEIPNGDTQNDYYFSQDKFFAFTAVTDGFWYFHLRVKYAEGWGPLAHYQIKVDTTAPEFFKPNIVQNAETGQIEMIFSALDKHSGVAYYENSFNETDWQKVQSPYYISESDRQNDKMYLRAVDNAGNVSQVTVDMADLILIEEEEKEYQLNQEELDALLESLREELIKELAVKQEKINLGEVVTDILDISQQGIWDNPKVELYSQGFLTPLLLGLAALNTIPSLALALFNALPFLHLLFSEPILAFFRRKRRKWGIVYDSLTKIPLEFAIIRLYKREGSQLIRTKVSDRQGRYLIMVNEPGFYYLTVEKPGYIFPSKYLKFVKEDAKYLDLYHGEAIEVTEKDGVIAPNIPMDPEGKKLQPAKEIIRSYLVRTARLVVSYLGIILAAVIVLIIPTAITITALIIHLILFTVFRLFVIRRRPKNWGMIYDQHNKKAISQAIIRISDLKFNRLLESQASDSRGRYGFLVEKNLFSLMVEKEGYQKKMISPVDLVKKEKMINFDIGLKRDSNFKAKKSKAKANTQSSVKNSITNKPLNEKNQQNTNSSALD